MEKSDKSLLAYSERHHGGEHVSQCGREEAPGWGVVSKSKGQVSHHALAGEGFLFSLFVFFYTFTSHVQQNILSPHQSGFAIINMDNGKVIVTV